MKVFTLGLFRQAILMNNYALARTSLRSRVAIFRLQNCGLSPICVNIRKNHTKIRHFALCPAVIAGSDPQSFELKTYTSLNFNKDGRLTCKEDWIKPAMTMFLHRYSCGLLTRQSPFANHWVTFVFSITIPNNANIGKASPEFDKVISLTQTKFDLSGLNF